MATGVKTVLAARVGKIPALMMGLAGQTKKFKKKTEFFPELYDFEETVFAVAAGAVIEVERFDRNNSFVEIHGPGDFFALRNLFGNPKRTTTAIAMPETEISFWAAKRIEDALSSDSAIGLEFAKAFLKVAARQRARMRAMTALKKNENKLAWVFLNLESRMGIFRSDGITFVNPGQVRLCGLIGTNREQVTQIMISLRKRRIIDYSHERIKILKAEALAAMASFEPNENDSE
jgi:CRP-like cAMP-binding protein